MALAVRVFDVAAASQDGRERRVLAISADSTVPDLYLALLGAFRWRGDYDLAEQKYYRVTLGSQVFESGKGSRTPLRRVLDAGSAFSIAAPGLSLNAEVTRSYEVQSRRHYRLCCGCSSWEQRRSTSQLRLQHELYLREANWRLPGILNRGRERIVEVTDME